MSVINVRGLSYPARHMGVAQEYFKEAQFPNFKGEYAQTSPYLCTLVPDRSMAAIITDVLLDSFNNNIPLQLCVLL